MGSLPFPGPSTLFKVVSPTELGTHSYARPRGDEASRGTVYTCRAGFLDLAHVRFTVDWTRYVHDQVRAALRAGAERVVIEGMDDTIYEITLDPPESWSDLAGRDREATHDEAALRIGQRVAFLLGTWHEILTYSGYKTTGILSEKRSAFTYEDAISHIVGLQVAQAALESTRTSYDLAVTQALDARLHELEIVEVECLYEGIEKARGELWEGNHALEYQVPSNADDGALPFLVEGLSCCRHLEPVAFELPPVDGELARISIQSEPARELGISRRIDDGPPRAHFSQTEFWRILDRIRAELDAAG